MTTSTWCVTLLSEGDDLILPIPDEILELQGWKEGDSLDWINNGDGTWTLKKL